MQTGSVNSQSDTGFSSFTLNTYEGYNYDQAGRRTSVFDGLVTNGTLGPAFAARQYSYDNANRLVCTAVRMNPAALNGASLPAACSQSPPGGDGSPDRITQLTYNADDSVSVSASGVGTPSQRNEVTNTYDSNGLLVSQADGKNNTTCYAYDGLDRLITKTFPSPSNGGSCNGSDFESYSYDANSNVNSHRLRDGVVFSYKYDALNRLTTDYNTSYTYDNMGRVTSAGTVSFSYDALGRKLTETNAVGGTLTSAYDAAGDRVRLTWPDNVYVGYTYDYLGRTVAIADGVGQLGQYTYDSFGRRTHATYAGGTSGQGFLYGSDNRPSVTGYGFQDTSKNGYSFMAYTAAGQLKARDFTNDLYDWTSTAGVQQSYGNNGLNEIAAAGSTSYSYDARGSLRTDGASTYIYNVYSRLTGVSGAVNATLGYDGLQRVNRTQGAAVTQFVYDGTMIAEELDGSGNLLRRYVPGPDGTPLVWYEGAGTGDRRWLIEDQQGSVIAVANGSGQSLATDTYDAYGLAGSSNLGRFQYAGRPFIPEVGLYDNAARSYSPTLGRFLQTDPAGYADGMNIYAYTHGDPVNGTDPTGLDDDSSDGGPDAPPPPVEGGALDFVGISVVDVFGHHPLTLGPNADTPGVINNNPLSGGTSGGGGGGDGRSGRPPQNNTKPPACSSPGPAFVCNGKGKLVPNPKYQQQVCANYSAITISANQLNAGVSGGVTAGGIALSNKFFPSPGSVVAAIIALPSAVLTALSATPPPPGCQ